MLQLQNISFICSLIRIHLTRVHTKNTFFIKSHIKEKNEDV